MATAKKTASGMWKCRIYDYTDEAGKKHYKAFTAETKHLAELQATQYRVRNKNVSVLLTIKDAMKEKIDLCEPVLSPSTVYGYKKMYKCLCKQYPAFMMKRIDKLTQNDVQGLVSSLARDKSPKTVRNYYALITSILPPYSNFNIRLPQTIKYEPKIPTEADIKEIIELAKDTELELPIMLGAYCMMRRSEICALTMNDILFKKKSIHIRQAMVQDKDRQWILKAPKTKGSDRTIQVPDVVLDKIKEQGYITKMNPDVLTDKFEVFLQKNNFPHYRFHDLRHYAASIFHLRGVPMSYTQKYGGWSTMNTLTRIYQHTISDAEQEIYQAMNDYFSAK